MIPTMARLVAFPALGALLACGGDGRGSATEAPPLDAGAVPEIASPAGPASGEPFLRATSDGGVLMSWIEAVGDSAHALRFAAWEGAAWSEPRTIARGSRWFVNWADFPSIMELPDGTLAAHWLVKSGPGPYAYDVHVATSRDGGATWTEPIVPHRDGTETEHGFVSLFPEPDGALGAVWLDGRKYAAWDGDGPPPPDVEMTVRYARLDPAGRVSGDALLDRRACDCCQTDAAWTSRGPVVVYRDRSPGEIRDIAIVRRVDGRWTEPEVVHADGWEIAACPVNGPAVVADGDRVAVAWFTGAGDSLRVKLAVSGDAGATFGAPVRIDAGASLGRVDLALLPGDELLVVWLEKDGADAFVRARRASFDGALGAPVTVARASEARAGGFPRVAVSEGRAFFAWTRPGEPARVHVAAGALDRFPRGAP